jgi:hypothetical protein
METLDVAKIFNNFSTLRLNSTDIIVNNNEAHKFGSKIFTQTIQCVVLAFVTDFLIYIVWLVINLSYYYTPKIFRSVYESFRDCFGFLRTSFRNRFG